MNPTSYVIHCDRSLGEAPHLSHAIMGNLAYNLLRTGVKLQRTLEGTCDTPLLRRTMSMLNSGIGIDKSTGVYREDAEGNPVYDFTLMDQIMDVLVSPRCNVMFGIGFMPEDLSVAVESSGDSSDDLPPEAGARKTSSKLPEPWMSIDRFPPRDYGKWYDLIRAVVEHEVGCYGEDVVSRWYWKFWNEPDLHFYWIGTTAEYLKTYDYAAAAVRDALPSAKVGGCGPSHPGKPIFKAFLEHCTSESNYYTGQIGSPLDFITFHRKGGPTGGIGVFGDPWEATDYEVRNPSLNQMIESTRQGMQIIASVPGTEGLPVLLTEFDIDWGTGTSIYLNPNMHYRNSEYFAAFQCAMAKRMLDLRSEFPDNPIQATFLDTFYIPGYRIFEGQRTLITGESVDKPILNALRLLGKLGNKCLIVTGSEDSSLDVLATTTDTGAIRVMAVNFGEAFDYDESHDIQIRLDGLAGGSWRCRHYRIDREHSNAYTVWLEMGRPVVPSDQQIEVLQSRHGLELAEPESEITVSDHLILDTTLPPHSVSLWELDGI